jgi:hypothetical protein
MRTFIVVAYAAFWVLVIGLGGFVSKILHAPDFAMRGIAFGFLSTTKGFVALAALWLGSILWTGAAPNVLSRPRLPARPLPCKTGESPSASSR